MGERGNVREKGETEDEREMKRGGEREREIMRLLLYTKCPIIFMLYGAT